jgi:hypothetical protein
MRIVFDFRRSGLFDELILLSIPLRFRKLGFRTMSTRFDRRRRWWGRCRRRRWRRRCTLFRGRTSFDRLPARLRLDLGGSDLRRFWGGLRRGRLFRNWLVVPCTLNLRNSRQRRALGAENLHPRFLAADAQQLIARRAAKLNGH